jgi:hypothetical protein
MTNDTTTLTESAGFVWYNGDNGAFLQIEDSPFSYQGVHATVEEAVAFLDANYDVSEDDSHIRLFELWNHEAHYSAADVATGEI